jgi:predicted Holliday junction resolvase-like endonuclease
MSINELIIFYLILFLIIYLINNSFKISSLKDDIEILRSEIEELKK